MVVGPKPGSLQSPTQHRVPGVVRRRSVAFLRKSLTQHCHGLRWDPHRLHPIVIPNLDDQSCDVGMKVYVFVGVDVVERQTGCAEPFELRADLARKLAADVREDKKSDPGAGHVPVEFTVFADEVRNFDLRQNGMTVEQIQVQADTKFGHTTSAGHRIGCCRAPDHQTRGRQDPIAMSLFDGLVDRRVEPKIVGANDQPPQPAISRLRRN